MTNMKTDGLNEYDKNDLCKPVKNSLIDDIPNLGSVITLDNKGRLINSQFSKPSSSQTLLKLNSSEEVPDADDLPYSVISYGDTPNAINLPYNDHNYIGTLSNKSFENYDKKALEYTTKQTIQYTNRSNFQTPTNLRISHFSSYNTNCLSQNDFVNNRVDNIFFNDKVKPSNQFNFNQNVNSLTPLITNKPLNNHQQPNGFLAKKQILPNAIVINSNSVNKLKGMSVIKLQRSNLEAGSMNESRIINVPINKPTLTNVIARDPSPNDINTSGDKSDKTINLIPRCVCRFIHDDGGMIRCEICQTWQHIICMYPDNKFPILYKCEKCEPREIDYKRAIATQTNNLIKAGHNAADFLVNQEYPDYEAENNVENALPKSHAPQYVIVQPELKSSFRHLHDPVNNTQNQIYITNSKDPQLVPPGSPRTSKRKQDLISLKTVLTKPTNSTPAGSFTVNNIVIHNNKTSDLQKSLVIENPMNYLSNYLIPTSTNQVQIEQREPSSSSSQTFSINEMSNKLKAIFCNKLQSHTNLTIQQEQYLRQNNSIINTNSNYQVIRINFNQHVIKSVTELNCNEVILEYNGFISLSEDYNKECDFRKHYNPFALFYDKFDHLPICIDAKDINSESKYIRRSCTPNAEVKHKLASGGHIRFFVTPINRISKDMEITIGFDFNYMKCRYLVECACNQPSCELIYMRMEEARSKKAANIAGSINDYDPSIFTGAVKNLTTLTRPHKKRGRASKILNTSNRQTIDKPVAIENTTPVVRRNKRGRPPLNRPNGIQRSDICVKASSDSSSNNCLTEFKEASDNESVHCRTNENLHPSLSLHSNFKNFKRISSSHWSLKAHRKLCASKNAKPCKKLIASKVGRPLKYKKEKIIETKKDIDFSSDLASSPERYNGTERSFDVDAHMSSNDEYERNLFDMKQEISREEEGKYWLEEINNKIYKQKLKEAKKVKRKNRIEKKLSRKLEKSSHNNIYNQPEIKIEQKNEIDLAFLRKECKEEIEIDNEKEAKLQPVLESTKDKKGLNLNTNPCKAKRGRKSLKNNKNYIVSYKTSNIDDLKNDLMLISASLEEDPEEQEQEISCDNGEKIQEEPINIESNIIIDTDETERHFSDSFEIKKLSAEAESDFGSKYIDSCDDKMTSAFKSKYRKSISNKSKDSAKDALKASREERWVNIMWQRILKSENSDTKSKRKRSKSSFADESNPSEENPIDCNELSSPKFGDSDFCDDNLSCDTKEADSFYKLSCAYKNKRKSNKLKSSSFSDSDKVKTEKLISSNISENATEMKTDSSLMSILSDENENKIDVQSNEQCGLIVYKEQQSNPMEKFSRENSAKMFNENYTDALNISSSGTYHPPHAKKRWLSQALLEENLNETTTSKTDSKLNDVFVDKFSALETSSKHSFLPPVITSMDNSSFSLTPQKIAMNPKKRLLNQFSMEDNAFRISSSNVGEMKSTKWGDHNMDQEQSKTKLTLSEYRKRRYSDKSSRSTHDTSLKLSKGSSENHSEWVGLNEKYSSPVLEDNSNVKSSSATVKTLSSNCSTTLSPSDPNKNQSYVETVNKLNIITDSSFIQKNTGMEPGESDSSKSTYLSYINTLNNLKMPRNLDPRLTKSISVLSSKYFQKIPPQIEPDSNDSYTAHISHESCPRSPSKSPNSDSEWKMLNSNDRGPRTPSDIDELSINAINGNECLSTYAPSQGSINSFESQPSPTSDCHFDFEKPDNSFYKDARKSSANNCDSSSASNDWTNHSVTIARLAGIQNPELLQEIEEFDDEYVPLPEKLPERSKEEMETLLLTQKRDSQIREWQEVKQLEREKVKLEHQVRSMQRRMQRVNKTTDMKIPPNKTSNDGDNKFGFSLMTTMDDEKTMKTFNVQLSNFNDRLVEQINIVKNNKSTKSQAIDLPLSYRLQDDEINIKSTMCDDNPDSISSTYSKYRKRGNDKLNSQKLQSEELYTEINPTFSLSQSLNGQKCHDIIVKTESISSISDHVPNFKSIYPEMTSSFM